MPLEGGPDADFSRSNARGDLRRFIVGPTAALLGRGGGGFDRFLRGEEEVFLEVDVLCFGPLVRLGLGLICFSFALIWASSI